MYSMLYSIQTTLFSTLRLVEMCQHTLPGEHLLTHCMYLLSAMCANFTSHCLVDTIIYNKYTVHIFFPN